MKAVIVFIFFLGLTNCAIAQAPNIQWQKCLGGSRNDKAYSLCKDFENGYTIVGYTESDDGNVMNHIGGVGGSDLWLIKLDSSGNIVSNKCLGGTFEDLGYSINRTNDGGYIIAGSTDSEDGDVSGVHGLGRYDYWVVKLDSLYKIQWQKCLGSTDDDEANEIIQVADSGYLVTGYVSWLDGDVFNFHGGEDVWVVKLNKNGVQEWAKTLGGNGFDWGTSCIQTNDGGYLVAGSTESNDGDVLNQHGNSVDAWVVKLNSLGHIEWQRCYGGTGLENGHKIIKANDGGFFLSSSTNSTNGDVSGNNGEFDYWLVKADSAGTIKWQKCFGGDTHQANSSANSTSDGGIVMIGTASSNDDIVTGTHGMLDWWICKIDSVGNLQWAKAFGGPDDEIPYSIQETNDGGYIAVGSTLSHSWEVLGNHGLEDCWVLKLTPPGLTVPEIQNTLMELNIFQNHDQLNLRFFSKKNETAQLNLYDINGKKVFEKNIFVNEGINNNSFNNSGLSKGMYFMKIDSKNGSVGGRVLIN